MKQKKGPWQARQRLRGTLWTRTCTSRLRADSYLPRQARGPGAARISPPQSRLLAGYLPHAARETRCHHLAKTLMVKKLPKRQDEHCAHGSRVESETSEKSEMRRMRVAASAPRRRSSSRRAADSLTTAACPRLLVSLKKRRQPQQLRQPSSNNQIKTKCNKKRRDSETQKMSVAQRARTIISAEGALPGHNSRNSLPNQLCRPTRTTHVRLLTANINCPLGCSLCFAVA